MNKHTDTNPEYEPLWQKVVGVIFTAAFIGFLFFCILYPHT